MIVFFLEQNGEIDKVFYNDESLHELRSCSKLLVAMAVGIAIDKGMFSLDTLIYPSIEKVTNITNKSNLEKIKECADKGHIAAIYDLVANFYYNSRGTDVNYELADYYLNFAKKRIKKSNRFV